MADYTAYIRSAGISGAAFTQALHEKYPSFTKIQKSMVCQPDKYGVQLVPEAEAVLVEAFGEHPGLTPGRKKIAARPRPVRTKPHRLVVYLPDDLFAAVRSIMGRLGYRTVQDFLQTLLGETAALYESERSYR